MVCHPQGHLVGDHTAMLGDLFVVLKCYGAKSNLEGHRDSSPLFVNRLHAAGI